MLLRIAWRSSFCVSFEPRCALRCGYRTARAALFLLFAVCSSNSPRSGLHGYGSSLLCCRFPRYHVSLRDEDLTERGFGCTGTRLRELRLLARPDICKRPWSLRALRGMAMARASLVRSSLPGCTYCGRCSEKWLPRASSFQLLREGRRGDVRQRVF